MRLNIVGKEQVAPGPYAEELVCVPVAIIPQVLSALDLKAQKYWYASPEDWQRGRSLLAQFSARLLMPCGQEIVNSVDRVYVLLAAYLEGTSRDATPSTIVPGAFDYTPVLSQSANASDAVAPSLWHFSEKTTALLANLVEGEVSTFASDPDKLKDLVRAINPEASEAKLDAIIDLLTLLAAAV